MILDDSCDSCGIHVALFRFSETLQLRFKIPRLFELPRDSLK